MPAGRDLAFDPVAEAERQWRAHGWEPAASGMAVVTSVMRAQQIFLSQVDSVVRHFELSFARYEVLMLLLFSRAGELPLGKVGERLQVHPASVTNAVDRLQDQGFVGRRPHPTDGRTTLAVITPVGRATAEAATRALNAEVFESTGMSGHDLAVLFDLLRKVRAGAGDFDPDPQSVTRSP